MRGFNIEFEGDIEVRGIQIVGIDKLAVVIDFGSVEILRCIVFRVP